MPRIRTVKPEHWSDRELTKISLQAHLLWIATWNFSDDKGIFDGDPILLKSQIFPRRIDVTIEQVSQWLDQLVKARFIIPFIHDEQGYYITRTFEIHQRIDKPQPSKFDSQFIKSLFQERSKNVPRTLSPVEDSRVEESRGEDDPTESELLVFDSEKEIASNQIWFETICMKTYKDAKTTGAALRKFHLHNVEKNRYPLSKKSIYAGFERWMMNEKENNKGNNKPVPEQQGLTKAREDYYRERLNFPIQ